MKTLISALFLTLNAYATDIYILKTQIGQNTFNDILVVENGNGTLTVPGQFTTRILNDTSTSTTYAFSFEAMENGSPLKGNYKLSSNDHFQTFEGELIIEDDHFPVQGEKIYGK